LTAPTATISSWSACCQLDLPEPEGQSPGICLDKGYDYDEVRELLDEFGFTAHIRSRGEEAQAIKQEAGYRARRSRR